MKMVQQNNKNSLIPEYLQKEILYQQQNLQEYDVVHDECDRLFVYFVSRIAIVFNPKNGSQNFYQGHKFKITCLAVHPSKQIVCSGESSNKPVLHIWSITNYETISMIQTNHKNGILNVAFTRDGSLIISVGFDKNFSIQLTNWRQKEILAFRFTGQEPIFDIIMNPYNNYEFVTAGFQNITFWEVTGKNLMRTSVVTLQKERSHLPLIITSISYISYNLGNAIQSDLICGNNIGDLGIVAHEKYIIVKQTAHKGTINCIRITKIYKTKILIITSGEDELIKIWDTQFNLINDINMRQILLQREIPDIKNLSAQSIDIFIGKGKKKINVQNLQVQQEQYNAIMLIGTRNGDIIETTIDPDYSTQPQHIPNEEIKSSDEDDEENQIQGMNEKFNNFKFNPKYFIRSHCSQMTDKLGSNTNNKKVYFSLHPKLPIMASVGQDMNLMIWETDRNQILMIKPLDQPATACKFHPNGDLLVIGFSNGTFQILDSRIQNKDFKNINEQNISLSLEVLMPFKDQKVEITNNEPILNIEFSSTGDMLAISFDSSKQDQYASNSQKEGSYIQVFVNRSSNFENKYTTKDKNLYIKYREIRNPSVQKNYQTVNNNYNEAVHFMTFSKDGNFLLLYYQLHDGNQIRINNDPKGNYIIIDLNTNVSVKNWTSKQIEWISMNFPNSINSLYNFVQDLTINDDDEFNQQINELNVPIMSSMLNHQRNLICGSVNGDIHFVKMNALHYDKDFFSIENIQKDKMCLAKSYSAHVSFVNQIHILNDSQFLYSTGVLDECIMKWRFRDNEQKEENLISQIDAFGETIQQDKFNNLIKEILPMRNEIFEVLQNIDTQTDIKYDIELRNIIGRKSQNSRNNLFYDLEERAIYISGCNLVITKLQKGENDQNLYQEFIKPDSDNIFSPSPEISAIALSLDRKMICAGTIQSNCKLIIWDIFSKSCLKSIVLINCASIQMIRFAHDNRHICATALTMDYHQCVYLIDSENSQILGCASFPFNVPFQFKDIEFFPNHIYKFLTCGHQVVCIWTYNGGTLGYQNLEIQIPYDLVEIKQNISEFEPIKLNQAVQGEDSELKVEFLRSIFLQEAIISAGDDGNLYIWVQNKIVKKQKAHKSPILCLSSSKSSMQFVSGDCSGQIIIWQMCNSSDSRSLNLERLYEYNLTNQKFESAVKNYAFHIQSLCLGTQYILVGTKSGDIYEIQFPTLDQLKQFQSQSQVENIHLRLSGHDDEIPKSVKFSANSETLFSLTFEGQFCVWDISSLKRIHVKHFHKQSIAMIVCYLDEKILIALENEVIVISNNELLLFPIENNLKLKYDTAISDIKISRNEKLLAVALAPNSDQMPKIEIFDLDSESNQFKMIYTIDTLSTSIEFMDFSTDNYYLLYKDNFEEVVIIDLQNKMKTNTIYNEFDLEWCSDGIKVHDKIKGIHSFYTDENQLIKITKLNDETVIVTDEMGTIRLFNYPFEQATGNGFLKCYSDHLNYINQCEVSPDLQLLATCSELDRCIFLWNVNNLIDKKTHEQSNTQQ